MQIKFYSDAMYMNQKSIVPSILKTYFNETETGEYDFKETDVTNLYFDLQLESSYLQSNREKALCDILKSKGFVIQDGCIDENLKFKAKDFYIDEKQFKEEKKEKVIEELKDGICNKPQHLNVMKRCQMLNVDIKNKEHDKYFDYVYDEYGINRYHVMKSLMSNEESVVDKCLRDNNCLFLYESTFANSHKVLYLREIENILGLGILELNKDIETKNVKIDDKKHRHIVNICRMKYTTIKNSQRFFWVLYLTCASHRWL
jgi:hypothetical protein